MFKVLVNAPSGKQEIILIESTGSYFDPARVLWDERTDGALPDITPGKMQRVDNQLITLSDFLPEHAEAVRFESIPKSVLMPAARIAMLRAGVLNDVDTLVASLGAEALVWWQTSVYIRRDFPLVEVVRVEMQWTNEYVDDLFINAKTIETEN